MLSIAWLTLPAMFALQSCTILEVFEVSIADEFGKLPDYTESGYNTAGAYFTTTDKSSGFNDLWTINFSLPPSVYITKQDGEFQFSLNGTKSFSREPIEILFVFQAEQIDSLPDLQKLGGKQYAMQKNNLSASVTSGNTSYNLTSASLNFNRSRIIYTDYDNRQRGVSLSGTFEIAGTMPDNTGVKLENGRFDILFSGYNGTDFDNGTE